MGIFHFLNLNLNFEFWPIGYRTKLEPGRTGLTGNRFPPVAGGGGCAARETTRNEGAGRLVAGLRAGWGRGCEWDENGRENLSTIFVSVFYYGNQERERNSRIRKRKRDIMVMETSGNRKVYRNALLLNYLSLCVNITLDTPLHKLFFKNMINVSCFL